MLETAVKSDFKTKKYISNKSSFYEIKEVFLLVRNLSVEISIEILIITQPVSFLPVTVQVLTGQFNFETVSFYFEDSFMHVAQFYN